MTSRWPRWPNAIGAEAEADPAGDVAGGTSRVRTGVEKRSAADISDVVVLSREDGSKLRVSDVARVEVEGTSRERAYYKGEYPAVSIRVDRSDLGDAIAMQATVARVADELNLTLPEGVKIELIRTRAEAITDRLDILFDNGMVGLALVVGLLFLFLSARTAFWVAAGIPVAMLAAVALMYVSGLTLNMISLFALIICLGIVVDDAIVVGEHADFRHNRLGEPCDAGGRERGQAHGTAGVFGHGDHGSGVLRADRHRRAVRVADRGYPVHGDRGSDRLAGGMFPDPAQPHGPCAAGARQATVVRPALAAGEPGVSGGSARRFSAGSWGW